MHRLCIFIYLLLLLLPRTSARNLNNELLIQLLTDDDLPLVDCPDFQHFDLRDDKNVAMKEMILLAHNGLRNRLALILGLADMLMMAWDKELCDRANLVHRHCQLTVTETKTNHHSLSKARERNIYDLQHQAVIQGEAGDLAHNSYFKPIDTMASQFMESAIYTWYIDHRKLQPPNSTIYQNKVYYELVGDNNFTHIVSPQTVYVGCSYGKFRASLSIVCFYFPYLLSSNKTVYFREIPDDYQCPYKFPLLDEVFTALCRYASYTSLASRPCLCLAMLINVLSLLQL